MHAQPIRDALDSLRATALRTQADRDAQKAQPLDVERLKQLIQTLRSVAASLPAELQGLIGGLIAEAEAAAASGDPISIGRLIAKLEDILAILQEILQLLAKGENEKAGESIQALVAKMTGMKKARDKRIRQQEANLEASLEAMMNLRFGDL